MSMVVTANNKERCIFQETRPPTSMKDFNEFYLSGKNSISRNLPTPVPQKTPDREYAWVGLKDVIANLLASVTPVERFDSHSYRLFYDVNTDQDEVEMRVSSTKCAHDLYLELKANPKDDDNEDVLFLWIKEWSDGFDPQHTKSNRNHVWMKTYTICPSHKGKNNERNTFVMSFANQSDR